jgi:phospholipid-binding lipoprotein MlaA
MHRAAIIALALSALLLAGCASRSATEQQAQDYSDPNDPLESLNRGIWDFNYDILDHYILRPVTVTYVDYMPQFARTGLLNIAENLEEPAYGVNNLLQGKVSDSLISLSRFVLNSTVGLFGSIDVATELGLTRKEEDFTEVLGQYGVDTGPYLMLPALGPSDVRTTLGDAVDNAYSPLSALNLYFTVLRFGIKTIETRALLMQQEQQLKGSADPYSFVKSAYFQNLQFKVQDGVIEKSAEEEAFEDDLDAFLDNL